MDWRAVQTVLGDRQPHSAAFSGDGPTGTLRLPAGARSRPTEEQREETELLLYERRETKDGVVHEVERFFLGWETAHTDGIWGDVFWEALQPRGHLAGKLAILRVGGRDGFSGRYEAHYERTVPNTSCLSWRSARDGGTLRSQGHDPYHEPSPEEILAFDDCIVGAPILDDDAVLFYSHTRGEHRCLSNFHESPIELGGRTYPTVEHYFQASKAVDDGDHERVRRANGPYEAKRPGKGVRRRHDWPAVRQDLMFQACLEKFRQNEELRRHLLSTGDRALHEYTLNDLEWGWYRGWGEDLLGRVLTQVRAELRPGARP